MPVNTVWCRVVLALPACSRDEPSANTTTIPVSAGRAHNGSYCSDARRTVCRNAAHAMPQAGTRLSHSISTYLILNQDV